MEDHQEKYIFINKYIESLPFFIYWEMDVIIVWACIFGVGFMFTTGLKMFILALLAFYIASVYAKQKRTRQKGFFAHLFYSFGLRGTKKLVPSHMRIFHGG
ncbi:MAG: type IV conjugative transfer system protein TraL [Campylobacterota bacterium]|nr:type IV conjugative transfer system protein TraL [Campylobacterota bacterium]